MYPATRFCTTPSASPAANVQGIERSRPNTAAVAEANSSTVYAVASSPSTDTASTPARPARPEPSIQARAEVASASMPRSVASRRRSTEARMRSPYGVCRMNAHNPAAATAETANVITWSLSSRTPSTSNGCAGCGPTPRGSAVASAGGSPATSTTSRPSAGSAIVSPMVATICAVSPAWESPLNMALCSR